MENGESQARSRTITHATRARILAGNPIDGTLLDFQNARDRQGNSALHLATTAAQVSDFARFGTPLEAVNMQSLTPLQVAVTADRPETVRALIEAGANCDVLEPATGNCLLHLAKSQGLAQLLIQHGAALELANRFGRTPLLEACNAGNADVVEYLLAAGADVNRVRTNPTNCLHYLCSDGDLPRVTALLEYGWDASALDRDSATPLHVCARFGQVEIARLLLQHGANKHLRDKWGRTPYDCIAPRSPEPLVGELASLLMVSEAEHVPKIGDEGQFERALRQRLASRWDCPESLGVAAAEISRYQSLFGIDRWSSWWRFHLTCGARAGGLFEGYAWRLVELAQRQTLLAVFGDEGELAGAPNFFSFLDYIGDYFWCFEKSDRSADPQVWLLDSDGFKPLGMGFCEFMLRWEQW